MTASFGTIAAPTTGSGARRRMRLVDLEFVLERNSVALVGRVERPGVAQVSELFFRFPADCAPLVGLSGDPFLATLLVPAMVAGVALEIHAPVSERLLRRTVQIQDLLTAWYPKLHRIEVMAPMGTEASRWFPESRGIGAFFSGGIDSGYTLLKNHLGWPSVSGPITHLIFGKGFDARLADAQGLDESEVQLRALAAQYGRTLVVVETNLRDVLDAPWGEMYHGAALAAVAHCLAPGLHTVLVPGSYTYGELAVPWGSHPWLDELWSTESVHLIHDGAETSRIGKLATLLQYQPALVDRLRVCFEDAHGSPRNCGRCLKCLRVMVLLRALGHLGKTPSFPAELPADYASLYTKEDLGLLPHILKYARATGDVAMVRTLERQQRKLLWQVSLPRLLRGHPVSAAALDFRANLLRRWRARRR